MFFLFTAIWKKKNLEFRYRLIAISWLSAGPSRSPIVWLKANTLSASYCRLGLVCNHGRTTATLLPLHSLSTNFNTLISIYYNNHCAVDLTFYDTEIRPLLSILPSGGILRMTRLSSSPRLRASITNRSVASTSGWNKYYCGCTNS